MDKLLFGVATTVTLVWALVVIVAFTHRPVDPQLITLATIVTPVMLALLGLIGALAAKRASVVNGNGKRAGNGGG